MGNDKEPTSEDLKKQLDLANKRIKIQSRELREQDLIMELIVTAGLVSSDKIRLARELVETDS